MTRLSLPVVLLLVLLTPNRTVCQEGGPVVNTGRLADWPYAARHAPRIGGSYGGGVGGVRLDIGGSLPLVQLRPADPNDGIDTSASFSGSSAPPTFEFGVDFFTWSRLATEANFKFPVEAIDYYFGLYAGRDLMELGNTQLFARLLLAHISAHLVDGEERFGVAGFEPVVYSREFVDLSLGGELPYGTAPNETGRRGVVRGSLGGRVLFHSIPDSIGRFRPALSLESTHQVLDRIPLSLRAGSELGVNREFSTELEVSLRLGLKFASLRERGLLLEGGYYSGRSLYGQYFARSEDYFWLGFAFGR